MKFEIGNNMKLTWHYVGPIMNSHLKAKYSRALLIDFQLFGKLCTVTFTWHHPLHTLVESIHNLCIKPKSIGVRERRVEV